MAAVPSVADDLELISSAAAQAARIAMDYFDNPDRLDVSWKGGVSPVSAGDMAVDAYLKRTLLQARPDYGWLSEESADSDPAHRQRARRTFVVDPIDGTRAFINGIADWCVSVAVVEDNKPVAGVLDAPVRAEVWTAASGAGAHLNGAPLAKVGANGDPSRMVIAGARVLTDRMDERLDGQVIRHAHVPSLALRMAMVAEGRLAGTFIKPNANDWDIAAAALLLDETGHALVDDLGTAITCNRDDVLKPGMIAARPDLVEAMLDVVGRRTIG